jgi:hypothetical protein
MACCGVLCVATIAPGVLSPGSASADELKLGQSFSSAAPDNAGRGEDLRANKLRILAPSSDDFMARVEIGEKRWLAIVHQAAHASGIPEDFFRRLLTQESAFNPSSVSRAGALGIAQFMPGTAVRMKLRDPFDAEEAILASARFVAALRTRFGNLGLAAAAYNAGEGRVQAWLAGRQNLPRETIDYVYRITGRSVEMWAGKPSAPMAITSAASPTGRPAKRSGRGVHKRGESHEAALCRSVSGASNVCLVRQTY